MSELLQQLSQSEFDMRLEQQRLFLKDRSRERPPMTRLLIRRLVIPQGFDFDGIDFTDTKFENVSLTGCRFYFTTLNRVDFTGAILLGCSLSGCYIDNTEFGRTAETLFENLSFANHHLQKKEFTRCRFVGCNFEGATLEYVDFTRHAPYMQAGPMPRFGFTYDDQEEIAAIRAYMQAFPRYRFGKLATSNKHFWFQGSSIVGCNFSGITSLKSVDFHGELLSDCILHKTDITRCRNFRFDKTDILGARLPYRSHDPWSILTRSYTGSNMLFNLLFLTIYFAPFIFKGLALIAVAHFETKLLPLASLIGPAEFSQRGQPPELFDAVKACAVLHCVAVPVWRVALGLNTRGWLWMIGLVLLGYNGLRLFLTWRIAPLKEEQMVSGITPAYMPPAPIFASYGLDRFARFLKSTNTLWGYMLEAYDAYAGYWIMHRLIYFIFFGAIGFSLWHLVLFFGEQILVPASLAG